MTAQIRSFAIDFKIDFFTSKGENPNRLTLLTTPCLINETYFLVSNQSLRVQDEKGLVYSCLAVPKEMVIDNFHFFTEIEKLILSCEIIELEKTIAIQVEIIDKAIEKRKIFCKYFLSS